ncbi:hypothetical protein SAPIO_CDS2114 [Scedosporium apiospermum]|uniref:Glutamate--tRNA ligase n=1 Tax=Pseudallescheria apiosperma TaxID=563466 RepID=A0A084GD99_PSEDA|nr:uncharacterized protein SAPIO_CDS2114 [Scedosporium apiospermum]KEZ45311.1 hypothetical protein SAPIO_CDS2114 [Scedosporium apiospermum]
MVNASRGPNGPKCDPGWPGQAQPPRRSLDRPDVGGPYGPYRQSERLDKYRPFADQLLESGQAYRCFCTAEDLEKHKAQAVTQNQSTRYPGTCRNISPEESADRAAKGETHVIRFKGGNTFPFVDRVYGLYEKKEEEDDFILIKSDGFPTYHFANVIDDHLMEITHVIRGAEWLISTPKHIALYDAFKWAPPEFFHVGLLTDNAGQKLSKRNHDVDVSSYRCRGLLPSALNNWLVLLGWGLAQGSSKNSELFTEMEDLINKFSFKFTKGNIKVNPQKLDSFQHKHAEYLFQNPEAHYPVLRESILIPTVDFVNQLDASSKNAAEEVKSSSGVVFDRSQHGDLIPHFASPESAEEYILKMFQLNTTRYGHHTDLIVENPQLVWTIPASAYDVGLASFSTDQISDFSNAIATVTDTLATLSTPTDASKSSEWTQKELQQAISAAISSLSSQYPTPEVARDTVYAALRFALLGDANKPSKPASVVFYLLGPEESLKRLADASKALTRARNPEIMNANQSRRRTDPDPGPTPVSKTRPKIDNTLAYQGRELDENSIRLVEIQPAEHETDPLVCTLCEVAFGRKPKFEALSYMWGTEIADDAITINDVPFEVKRNLRDALLFFRRRLASGKAPKLLWIDAICINQSDVEERNRQLRIMDQIYFRACTVVVWLGSRYTEFQREMIEKRESEEGEKREDEDPSLSSNSIQQNMVRHLRTDPYWERLWILQEIGHAKKLQVCYGGEATSWDLFMHFIAMHNSDGNTGPLRLDRLLRQEKYNDSHTLKRLLEEHREAKCSEPRDKVYGLVGLASDAADFPMDYNKSLYDVWKDTMVFMNQFDLFKGESQIVLIGALVKRALMEGHGDPLSQISSGHEDQVDSTQLIEDKDSPLVFRLNAVPLGCIAYIGPSASDVISKPSEASMWRMATQRLFPADELGQARWEHDSLLYALLESDESEMEKKCFNRPSTVVWRDQRRLDSFPATAQGYTEKIQQMTPTSILQLPQVQPQAAGRLASVQPRLYLARSYHGQTSRKMGVASGLAQRGDLVCWVRSSRRALLVRVVELSHQYCPKMRVFGTAMATEDICSRTPDCDYAQRWQSLGRHWRLEVQVDAGTIFTLLE